jgi:hypothetical protein
MGRWRSRVRWVVVETTALQGGMAAAGINIKSPETHRLTREVAELTGET